MKTAGWFVLYAVCLVLAWLPVQACSPGQAKTVADVTIKIADDVCHEVTDAGQDQAWTHLLCTAIGVAGGVVDVLLPSREWAQIRARRAALLEEAGPGK